MLPPFRNRRGRDARPRGTTGRSRDLLPEPLTARTLRGISTTVASRRSPVNLHACLGLIVTLSLGCGGKGGKELPCRIGDAGKDPIIVGHYASMTGAQATFGISTDRAACLAIQEINAAGGVNGRKLALVTID